MNAQTKVETQNVYQLIAAIQGELAKTGISKDGVNQAQNYKFRGIDQVYAALSPLLARYGLCILPRMVGREMHERVNIKEYNGQRKESVLFYVTVEAEFDFVSSGDGSVHTIRTFGEAMDSGDKATNKAMSAAYKYAAFMTFAIPTEGDNDADAQTHEVAPRQNNRDAPFPQGPCKNKTELKEKGRDFWREVSGCGDPDELAALLATHKDLQAQLAAALPDWWQGGSKDGEPYEGLATVIANKQTEFANEAWKQNPVSAG